MKGYKLETWKKTKWKGTQRETVTTQQRLVKRYTKGTTIEGKKVGGRYIKGHPIISTIKEKTYGSGVYRVGYNQQGRIVTRKKIAERTPQWYENRKEVIKNRKMYRTTYAVNDIHSNDSIPWRGNNYYGFRIIAFSHNQKLLSALKPKLKLRLIRFIEECLGYKRDEYWIDFVMYWGYEAPTVSNAFRSEDSRYYLQWTKKTGTIMKQEEHRLGDL